MKENIKLGQTDLTTESLVALCRKKTGYQIENKSWEELDKRRAQVEAIAAGKKPVYGINTGFGYLSDVQIPPEKIASLQVNFLRSHACGVGDPIGKDIVLGMMITKIHQFLLGHSGVSSTLVRQMLHFFDNEHVPYVPKKGSVGASGDLAPLSHIGLGLIGEGFFLDGGKKTPASDYYSQHQLNPLTLGPKEGLSIANGTHYMAVAGAFLLERCKILAKTADIVAAVSLDAFRGSLAAFDERIHAVRKQKGQILVAENIRKIFASGKDEIMDSHKDCGKIQDPYSYRCLAQVHGCSRETISFSQDILNRELNSSTDNPLMFSGGDFISGGNFHGQPIAMILDYLAIAIAEIGNIAERRIEKLTIPHLSGLPAFLVKNDEGLHSGFMIAHYTSSSLVAENKLFCMPASVDSIPTSANKEDHVSMGPNAIHKLEKLVENVGLILSIELLAACQGVDLLAPHNPTPALKEVYNLVRSISPTLEEDRSLTEEIHVLNTKIHSGEVLNSCPVDIQ